MTNAEKLLHLAPWYISSPFGWRAHPITGEGHGHNGTDYATYKKKVPCFAVDDGIVKRTSKDRYGALFVYVEFTALHRVGLYYHLDKISVKVGQKVTADTQIGIVGDTGRTTGIHLHFSWIKLNSRSLKYYEADYEDYEKYVFEEEKSKMIYQTVKELPKYLQHDIQELVDTGILQGDQNGHINLTLDMARVLVINKRGLDDLKAKLRSL